MSMSWCICSVVLIVGDDCILNVGQGIVQIVVDSRTLSLLVDQGPLDRVHQTNHYLGVDESSCPDVWC